MKTEIALELFRLKRVLTIEELTSLLKRSVKTARRFLKQHQCFTSINLNARYYTLADIPRFDTNGLWSFEGVFFSQIGNLRETLIQLIEKSEIGLSATEIGRLVGLPENSSFMSTFKDGEAVRRKTIGGRGTGRFIYFAHSSDIWQRQYSKRRAVTTPLLSDSEAIAILVELIRHPLASPADLAGILLNKGKRIEQYSIEDLIARHSLEKKNPE